jgi:threonine dehydrogenase-like Zn-dependent dehydrogenase
MRALVVDGQWEPRVDAALTEEELAGRWVHDARLAWRHPAWSVTTKADPIILDPDEVIVRVRAAGIAISTIRMTRTDADGYVVLPYRMGLPLVPGHEFAGEVVEVGSGVTSVRVGEAVAVETLRACGRCSACLRGRPNACLDGSFAGFNLDGGLAEYAVVPQARARSLEPLRERYDERRVYEIGALCESAGVSYVAMFEIDRHLRPGMSALVLGCGPLGLSAVGLARCAGAASVMAVDHLTSRTDLATALGADRVFVASEVDLCEAVLDATAGRGVDVVIEATGAAADVLPAIGASLAVGAHIIHLGVGGPAARLRPIDTMVRGASHSFSMGHLGGFDPVIRLHEAGRLDLTGMIGSRRPLEEALTALEETAQRDVAKALVTP